MICLPKPPDNDTLDKHEFDDAMVKTSQCTAMRPTPKTHSSFCRSHLVFPDCLSTQRSPKVKRMASIYATLMLLFVVIPRTDSWRGSFKCSNNPSDSSSSAPTLSSCFPRDVPVGLRREAIASALTSRGICINLSEMNTGVVQVKGKGCLGFLNSKLSNSFPSPQRGDVDAIMGSVREACLLTPKGRLIDKLIVPYWNIQKGPEMEAFLITSPDPYRHYQAASSTTDSCYLYQKLSPLIFPMDQIKISDYTASSNVLAFSCTDINILNDIIVKTLSPFVAPQNPSQKKASKDSSWLPKPGEAVKIALNCDAERDSSVIIASNCLLPNSMGYIMVIINDSTNQVRDAFCDDQCAEDHDYLGTLPLQALDYETLRIDMCLPGVGREITGDDDVLTDGCTPAVKSGPLELGLRHLIDETKGCYLGQEGIAALSRNPRGLPRTIYQVLFEDVSNDPSEVSTSMHLADALCPKAGDTLFVLGSNQEIKAGVLTSVLPPDDLPQYHDDEEGVSTVGIALIRRPQYILQKMEQMGLESLADTIDPNEYCEEAPLHGLEVIVGDRNTIGRLRAVPIVRKDMQQGYSPVSDEPSSVMGVIPAADMDPSQIHLSAPVSVDQTSTLQNDMELSRAMEEAEVAKIAAEKAAAEAKRAQEKLKDLQSRVETTSANKGPRYSQSQPQLLEERPVPMDEDTRKKEKIALLKARAEAVIEARRKKKETGIDN